MVTTGRADNPNARSLRQCCRCALARSKQGVTGQTNANMAARSNTATPWDTAVMTPWRGSAVKDHSGVWLALFIWNANGYYGEASRWRRPAKDTKGTTVEKKVTAGHIC